MSEFKVGDIVECVRLSRWDYPGLVGERYAVEEVRSSGLGMRISGSSAFVDAERFKLAPRAEPEPDPVNRPAHYIWLPNGVEVIDITKNLSFCLGNVVKYTLRADRKGKAIEDLKKAQTYLRYEIERREEIARQESAL